MNRRQLLASGAALLLARRLRAEELSPVYDEIGKRHFEALDRLRRWVKQPTIAAENRGMAEGNALLIALLREAGFQRAERVPTDGHPGVFATLDAGARKTVGLYFMYDVKQVKPEEWSSPPWEARLVDVPGLGKAVMGRGSVNQKGPEASFLAALHAIRGAGRKLPVNLVLVAEGEEEIGSPHFHQIVERSDIRDALSRTVGVFMPSAAQGLEGEVSIALGAKGVVELELIADGGKWGRGPRKDIHSGNRARVDSPAFHLVQALATLVTKDGDPAIDGFADAARGLDPDQLAMIDEMVRRSKEATQKEALGVERWAHDADFRQSLVDLCSRPTVNIQGLVGGYTGPGGMTILPHHAVAKMDLRLVPDMTRDGAVAALKAHLANRGFGDLEVKVTGGYDPTQTPARSGFIDAQKRAYSKSRVDAQLWPRTAGSYPGYVFTSDPLRLPAGHFGLGHGLRAHAPDEYYLIESTNSKVQGMDGAVRSFVDYLYELATV
jgi:acetylornithine deacetylase/succinyl-diaminopimelate desuccinylase-like protein